MKKISLLLFVSLICFSAVGAPGDIHYAGELQVEVRKEGNENAEVLFVVALGRKLVEFDRKGEFVWVGIDKMGGKDGWVHISDVKPTDPDGLKY